MKLLVFLQMNEKKLQNRIAKDFCESIKKQGLNHTVCPPESMEKHIANMLLFLSFF